MRKKFLASAVAATLAISLAYTAQAATPADTLIVARNIDDVISLDPAENFESVGGETLNNLYTRLVTFEPGDFTKLTGGAAESWTASEDGKLITFKIRKGLTFPSGRALTAEDAAFSLQRAILLDKTPAFILSQFGWTKDNVKELVTAPDAETLELRIAIERAPSLVLNALTSTVASVVDKEEAEAHAVDNDFGSAWLRTHTVGTGAYRLIDWKPKQAIALEANPGYYRGAPPLKRVVLRHVPEAASQLLLLQKGDVDIARDLTSDQIETLGSDTNFTVWTDPKQTVFYLNFNLKNDNLNRPKVREALRWLVDYEGIASTLLRGRLVVHQAFIGQGTFGALADTPFHLDVEKAKGLLKEAGLTDGFSVSLNSANSPPASTIAQSLQSTFAKGGVTLNLEQSDRKQVLTKYRGRDYDITLISWEPDYLDPHSTADYFTRNPDNSEEASNKTLPWRASWDIPELTKETDAAAVEKDAEKRKALYLDLQRKLQKDSPLPVLFQSVERTVGAKSVIGFTSGPVGDTLSYALISKQ